MRIAEIDLDAGLFSELAVPTYFPTLIIGHGFSDQRMDPIERSGEACQGRGGAGVGHASQYELACCAFD